MATNPIDNRFGLPKPDFQALPKKKSDMAPPGVVTALRQGDLNDRVIK